MFIPTDIINASLVIKSIPELACFETFTDLLKALPQYLGVEVPASVSNVIVSNQQPSSSQTTSLWIRLSNSGSFLGIYVFSQGQWHNIYPIADDKNIQIEWFTSTDGTAPTGWTLIDTGDTTVDPAVVTQLLTQYVFDPTNTFFIYAAFRFSGF